jgi:hypothetical protein
METMLATVVDKLMEQTKGDKVRWEDVSSLSAERYQTGIEDITVELLSGERPYSDDLVGQVEYCRIRVLDATGLVVAEATVESNESEWRRLNRLLDVARTSARRGGTVLQKLLTTLSK